MARLPIVDSDSDDWGTILNTYLSVSLNGDGTPNVAAFETALNSIYASASALTAETARAEAAEALLAPKASPALTGSPTTPTASPLTNSTEIASTAYADAAVAVEKTRAQAAEATKVTNPMTGEGDVIYNHSGAPARLALGTNGQVLTSNGTDPVWQTPSGGGGFSDPMTTEGDLIYYHSGGASRLGVGTNGQVLTSNGTDPSWQTPAGGGGGITSAESTDGTATINVTGGVLNITQAGQPSFGVVTTSPQAATGCSVWFANCASNAIAIDLPPSTGSGTYVTVKKIDAITTNHLTVVPNGSDTMDNGSGTSQSFTNGSPLSITAQGAGGTWFDGQAGTWFKTGSF